MPKGEINMTDAQSLEQIRYQLIMDKSNLECLEMCRNELIKDDFCELRYFRNLGRNCNRDCDNCPLKNFRSIIHESEDSNELLLIKLLDEEKSKTGNYYILEIFLKLLNKSIHTISDQELIALHGYYLKDSEFSCEELQIIENEILNRVDLPYNMNNFNGQSWFNKIENAIKILKSEN